jgi:predicted transcriptional regulator
MSKKVTISLSEELNFRWGAVAKKHKISKSGMISDYLEQILPILEEKTENKMLASAMREMSKTIDLSATLFDD